MSFADKKGIVVASPFKYQGQNPLDLRTVVDTIAERNALLTENAAYEGIPVYVKEDKTVYVYNGTEWDKQAKGSGYTHPTTPGNKHIPAGGSVGQILKNKADGEAEWGTLSAGDVGAIPVSQKGAKSGVASLDASGRVPAAQLPSYVDDVLEGYLHDGVFYKEEAHTNTIDGESGKIYVDIPSNKTYRWSGSGYTEISASLALGETAGSAYPGDKGKIAYDHSQSAHAPANAQKNVQSDWNESSSGSDAYIKNKPTSMPANGGNADTVGGHTVEANVPADAKFTDTVYTHPTNHPATMITEDASHRFATDAEKAKWNAKPEIYFADSLPESAPAGSLCFLISK